MTKTIKKSVAFLSAAVMVMAMLLYFPSRIFSSINWGLSAIAGEIIPPQKPEGEGTLTNPYKIGTKDELYWFAGLVNGDESVCTDGVTQNTAACAVLTENITVNEKLVNDDGTIISDEYNYIWTPIGNSNGNAYTGTFDGQNHTITGIVLCLSYSDASARYIGLFGNNDGTIKNVGVVDSSFTGYNHVGGVCGHNAGTIINCYNTGKVVSRFAPGGVCGVNDGSITHCYNTGEIRGLENESGGVCGMNDRMFGYGIITNCYNTGKVSGPKHIGNVCGFNYSTITNCYFDSTVCSGNAVGFNSGTLDKVEGKPTEQFASGELAYLFQSTQPEVNGKITEVWGQEIGKDPYPVIGGKKVYQIADTHYSNYDPSADPNYTNITVPAALDLTYSGSQQTLITAGSVSGGTFKYKLGEGSFSESLPTATKVGTYVVYYYIENNSSHTISNYGSIIVTISAAIKNLTSTVEDYTISVNWTAIPGAGQYKAYIYDNNGNLKDSKSVTTNSASFTSKSFFIASQTYVVEVCAVVDGVEQEKAKIEVAVKAAENLNFLNIDYSSADITYAKGIINDNVFSGQVVFTTVRPTSYVYANMIKEIGTLAAESGERLSVETTYDNYIDYPMNMTSADLDYYIFTKTGFRIDDLDFTLSKEGYIFKGWYIKNADGTETALNTSTYICFEKGVTNVYAKFEEEGAVEIPNITGVKAVASYDESVAKNSITVSWNQASGVDGYAVYFRNASGTLLGTRKITSASTTFFTSTSLNYKSGATIKIYVCGYIGCEKGEFASTTVTMPEMVADTTIKDLKATAQDSTIKVNWTAVTGATQYKVYVYDDKGTFKASKTVSTNSSSLTSAKLFSPNSTYTITVWAVVDGVAQEKSSTTVTMPETFADTTIKDLKATAQDSTIKVNWTAVTGATKYKVYVYDSKGTLKCPKTVAINSASLTSAKLFLPGQTYTVKVWAVVGVVSQEKSSINVTMPEAGKNAEVKNLKVSAVTGYVTASWDAVAGATKYAVYYYNEDDTRLASKSVNGTSYTTSFMKTVITGETITVAVKATLSDGSVTEFTKATAVVGVGTPADLAATKSGTTVKASWTALAGVDGYAVYFSNASGTFLGSKAVTTNSVSSTSSKYGTDVYVQVKAYKLDANGNKVYGSFCESVKAE